MTTTVAPSSGATAAAAAASELGKPYAWATPLLASTANPKSFDCSGLTMWSYGQAGVNIPHNAQAQYRVLKHRPLAQVQVGDLVFLGYGGSSLAIHHAMIYSGNGNVIEAPTYGIPVRERPIGNSKELIKMVGAFPGSTSTGSSTGSSSLSGPLATIVAFLRGKGLSDAQVAGVTGNWRVESNFNSSAYNAGEGAIGIAQWEGSRRTRLQALAAARGTKETDLGTQLAFFWQELTGDKATYNKLKASTDAVGAATVIQADYERSNPSSLADRQSYATKIAAQLASGGGLAGLTDGTGADVSTSGGTDGTDGGLSGISAGSLLPWNWGDTADSIVQSIISFVVKLAFAAAGMGLVLLGVNRAAKAAGS